MGVRPFTAEALHLRKVGAPVEVRVGPGPHLLVDVSGPREAVALIEAEVCDGVLVIEGSGGGGGGGEGVGVPGTTTTSYHPGEGVTNLPRGTFESVVQVANVTGGVSAQAGRDLVVVPQRISGRSMVSRAVDSGAHVVVTVPEGTPVTVEKQGLAWCGIGDTKGDLTLKGSQSVEVGTVGSLDVDAGAATEIAVACVNGDTLTISARAGAVVTVADGEVGMANVTAFLGAVVDFPGRAEHAELAASAGATVFVAWVENKPVRKEKVGGTVMVGNWPTPDRSW